MAFRLSLFLTAITLACISSSFSAIPLSLPDAIREALANNQDLQVSRHDQLIANADITTAGLRNNPSLNVIGDVLPFPGERYDPGSKYYGLSLSVPLDPLRRRSKRTDYAIQLAEVAKNTYEDNARQVRLRVETAYYTALALRDRLELANQNLQSLTDFVNLNKIRASQQQIPDVDVARAEYTRGQYEADVRNISTDYNAALLQLEAVVGRTVFTDSLTLASDIEDLVQPDSISIDSAIAYAERHRPDYRALQSQIESEEANEQLQSSLAYPDVSVSLDYSRQQFADFYGATLNLGLPIFNRNQGERKKSEYRVSQSRIALTSLQVKIRTEIQTAYDEMMSRWTTVQQQKKDLLPQAEQILQSIGYAYKIGNTTLLDYLEAQRSFTESRITYIATLLDYHISQSIFESALSHEELQ